MSWLWSFRKTSAEIKKLKAETEVAQAELAQIKRREAVKDASIILLRQASGMLKLGNVASATREEWASFLPDPSLVDEALAAVGAERLPFIEERWEIRLSPKSDDPPRWTRR